MSETDIFRLFTAPRAWRNKRIRYIAVDIRFVTRKLKLARNRYRLLERRLRKRDERIVRRILEAKRASVFSAVF